MIPADKVLAEKIAAANGTSIAKLGLRFDKVAIRLLSDVRETLAAEISEGTALLWTITAPIKLPAKTAATLRTQMSDILHAHPPHHVHETVVFQNKVILRLIRVPGSQPEKMIGFVHNPDSDAHRLLDWAAVWLINDL